VLACEKMAKAKTALHGKVNVCESTAMDKPVMHHCHIVETGNEYYRFSHSNATAKRRGKQREAARKRFDAESSM